ncbi:MAG: PBP1A family penicillin-binding protein, partial [Spirochaetales bacterium]|nr:PBP1A family penicillin-binding protein [Spirochaetales bacterium]
MPFGTRRAYILGLLIIAAAIAALGTGAAAGVFVARTRNIQRTLAVGEYTPALPSLILDRRGKLITRFFSEEKREILALDDISPHLVHAALAKEDRNFYGHIGFSLKGILRAAWNIFTGNYFSGGSTISQQVAGSLYQDREVKTVGRKLKELFWSLQLEKSRSKDEILEVYLNNSSFGHGTYGVEAACQFYFGHSAREVTPAEAAMLVTQLARINSMIHNPNRAKIIQRATLDSMVELSFITRRQADDSFDEFWRSYDATRSNLSTAYTERYDEAPYFSELVRQLFEKEFYGPSDLYRDGYLIHTTLDLDYQRTAEALLEEAREQLEATYRETQIRAIAFAEETVLPVVEMLSYLFSESGLGMEQERKKRDAMMSFSEYLEEPLEAIALAFGTDEIRRAISVSRQLEANEAQREEVESALVTIENETGRILAMVGGSDFTTRKFNLATDALLSPGSAVKPLYYASAVENGTITPATMIYDSPAVFVSDFNPPYAPRNFLGYWSGPVSAREALANSMNIPSLKVLEAMGLEAGISSIAEFLGREDVAADRTVFPRAYHIGLGTIGVSPLELASAYMVFPRQGLRIEPFAIRYIEDRYGVVILDNERKFLQESAKLQRIITPQAASVMTDMLTTTLTDGTLARRVAEAGGLPDVEMAAKTGTTENWSDAWAVGFSPYVTTAVWFGFVIPGNSLGRYQTGALAAGPVWISYMKEIHRNLPRRKFTQPESGLITRKVCSISGMLPTKDCPEVVDEVFIIGTEPEELCTYHPRKNDMDDATLRKLHERLGLSDRTHLETL